MNIKLTDYEFFDIAPITLAEIPTAKITMTVDVIKGECVYWVTQSNKNKHLDSIRQKFVTLQEALNCFNTMC